MTRTSIDNVNMLSYNVCMGEKSYLKYKYDKWGIGLDPGDKQAVTDVHMLYMLNRTLSMFRYRNLPDSIPENILALMLQCNGNVFITTDDEGELRAFTGGLGGEPDIYYRPTIYTIANPRLKESKMCKIGIDGVLIRNDPMLLGLLPLHSKYARSMTENELSMNVAMINARIPAVLTAEDDNFADAADEFVKNIVDGKLSIICASSLTDGMQSLPYSSNVAANILKALIENEQYLRGSWYNELGLNSMFNMKREAINEAESDMNIDALLPLVDSMLAVQKEDISKVNEMYGTNIIVEKNSAWEDVQADSTLSDEVSDDGGDLNAHII